MNKSPDQQSNSIVTNELFALPPDKYSKQAYSENFIQLFKNALTKVYSPKKSLKSEQSPKHSLATITPIQRSIIKETTSKKSVDSIEKESFPSYLTERQRLINQILNGKTQIMTANNKKLISKRCKTLENPQSTIDHSPKAHQSRAHKIPFKLKQAFNLYKNKSINDDKHLPPIAKNFSPNSKKSLLENLQIINKYRMLDAQFRSNEFISTPIQIFSVCSPSSRGQSGESKINLGISKLTKQSIIRSKSKRIKYALDGISKNYRHATQTLQNPQYSQSYRLDTLLEEDQILEQMWKDKEKTIESIKGKINGQNHNMVMKKTRKKKLIQRQPLDQYFRPWENSSQAKRYSQFSCHEGFPIVNGQKIVTCQDEHTEHQD